MSIATEMNCFVCRHCKVLPQTDMSDPVPIIHCAKRNLKTMLIVSECALANGSPYYVGKICMGGDRLTTWHSAADAYLKAHYNRLPMPRLVQVLRRGAAGIYHRASRLGLTNRERRYTTAHELGRARQGTHPTWTAAQFEYLRERYGREDWPVLVGVRDMARRQARDEERAQIVATIASLGPPHSWHMIVHKCRILFTPTGKKQYQAAKQRAALSEAVKRAARRSQKVAP
jgi:hypothetical protein